MNSEDQRRSGDEVRRDQPKKKKPYQKPAFQHERVFETMALSCGKLPGHFRCGFNRKLS